jgi:high-affinity iron transporter
MLASLLIVFREVLEAGLIVGIVLAATRGVAGRASWIALGIGGGAAGSCLLAVFAGALSDAMAGIGQEVFNAVILSVAVIMLGWHNVWMAHHGRELARQMTAVGRSVAAGQKSLLALAIVVAVAVLREGSEVVLFLYGIAASSNEGPVALLIGGALGIGLGGAVAWLLYRGLLAIPTRRLFSVTSGMIALLAAGMAGQAAAYLAKVDVIPSWGDQLWDTSALLPDDGIVGRALHALIGYSDRPMGVQLAAYLAVLTALVLLSRMFSPGRPAARSGLAVSGQPAQRAG